MEPISASKNTTNLYLLFAGGVVIILLVIGYFAFFAKSAVPVAFFSLYQQEDTVGRQTIGKMQFNYSLIGQQIQAKNASEAARLAKEGLVQSLKNKDSVATVTKKTGQLKVLLSSVTDTTLREKVIKLFGLLDERNKRMATLIDTHITIFTTLRNQFGALSVGEKGQAMPQNIDTVIGATQKEVQAIGALQTTIDVAYQEIVQLAGVSDDINVSQTTNSIRMSLSATPEKQITITDFPTPTPTPTLAVSPTSEGSSSATATESAE